MTSMMYTRGSTSAGNALVYRKQTITQVRKTIEEHRGWTGFLVPNKVNSLHFYGGWRLAYDATFTDVKEMETAVSEMLHYMEPELGNRVAFYEEVRGREVIPDEA